MSSPVGNDSVTMPNQGPAPLRLSVIVPATDSPPTVRRCTQALEGDLHGEDEVIVVTEAEAPGPAAARNAGAASASGDVIVFVDADVVVHRGALGRIRSAFANDAALTAMFGSYDDSPEASGAVSGFRNLLHHHVHQSSAGPVATFWAGLGAIRRDAFLEAGGFDAERFSAPSVEDVEFGMRLTSTRARVVLDPELQGTHLKRWTLAGMVHTDLVHRGIPWIGLLLGRGVPRDVLNLGWRHRLSAAATLGALLAIALGRPRPTGIAVALMIALNRSLYALVWRRRGPREAVVGIAVHAIHHMTGIIALPAGVLVHARHRLAQSVPRHLSPAERSNPPAIP
jgi:glycosyltransferase involved in cell wall biosynthesis